MRGDHSGAGAAAAGAGDPGAALPDPQPDQAAIAHRRHADIGALRKQLVMLEDGTQRRHVDRLGVVDEKGRVRVADIGADRHRQRPERQIQASGVHGPRQRDLAPAGARRPHIDRDLPVGHDQGFEEPGRRLDPHPPIAGLAAHQPADAAGGVAAGLGLAAVRVADAHQELRCGIGGRLQHDQLVAADAGAAVGQGPSRADPDRELAATGVEHDKIVAEAVHLQKRHLAHCACLYGGGAAAVQRRPPSSRQRGRLSRASKRIYSDVATARPGMPCRAGSPQRHGVVLEPGVPRAAAARRRAPFPYRPGSTGADRATFEAGGGAPTADATPGEPAVAGCPRLRRTLRRGWLGDRAGRLVTLVIGGAERRLAGAAWWHGQVFIDQVGRRIAAGDEIFGPGIRHPGGPRRYGRSREGRGKNRNCEPVRHRSPPLPSPNRKITRRIWPRAAPPSRRRSCPPAESSHRDAEPPSRTVAARIRL